MTYHVLITGSVQYLFNTRGYMSSSEQTSSPLLEKDQIIPAFTLPGADGMPHGPWDYKQREHLVLLFMRSATMDVTRELLRTFASHYTEFREEYCAILG